MAACDNCGKEQNLYNPTGQPWWDCNKYFGITGFFCPSCYLSIRHDKDGNPLYPKAYTAALLKFGFKQ